MRLIDAAAQASHLIYQHLNCVAAGLVDRPEQMPDHAFDFGLWKTGGFEVARPPGFFSDKREERLPLAVTPSPRLYEAFGGDMEALVYHMERLTEEGLRAQRSVRTRPVQGARAVRRLRPVGDGRRLSGPRPASPGRP